MQREINQKGVAMVILVTILAMVGIGVMAYFGLVHSEFKLSTKATDYKRLEYLTKAALNLGYDKLKKSRWYQGKGKTGGSYTTTLDGAKVTIHCDDYAEKKKRSFKIASGPYAGGSMEVALLDHVKIYVEVESNGRSMYGYGKYIISPSPLYNSKSTQGLDPFAKTAGSDNPESIPKVDNSFRKLIHQTYINDGEIKKLIPEFNQISDLKSRLSFRDYMVNLGHDFAKNYVKNLDQIGKIQMAFAGNANQLGLGQVKGMLMTSGGVSSDLSQIKNQFVASNFEDFYMDTRWDREDNEKDQKLNKTSVKIGDMPAKSDNPDAPVAMDIVFGSAFPKEPDFHPGDDSWSGGIGNSAASQFLEYQNYESKLSMSPENFVDEISRVVTAHKWTYEWEAHCVVALPPCSDPDFSVGSNFIGTGKNAHCSFVHYHQNQDNPDVLNKAEDSEFPCAGEPGVNFSPGIAGEPIHTNFNMIGPSGQKMPVSNVMHFFLKYVDETNAFMPDETGVNVESWFIHLAPGGPTTAGGTSSAVL